MENIIEATVPHCPSPICHKNWLITNHDDWDSYLQGCPRAWRAAHSSWPVWLVYPASTSFHGIIWHWIISMKLTQWFGVNLTQITIKRHSGFWTTRSSPLTWDLSHACELLWFGSGPSVFQQHYYLCSMSPEGCGVAIGILYPVSPSTYHWKPGSPPQPLVQVPCPCQASLQGCLTFS